MTQNKKHLPVGLQEFRVLIQEGCVYVDKTQTIHELLSAPKCPYFLSRPRRFGKSLLLSTLEGASKTDILLGQCDLRITSERIDSICLSCCRISREMFSGRSAESITPRTNRR